MHHAIKALMHCFLLCGDFIPDALDIGRGCALQGFDVLVQLADPTGLFRCGL